MKLIYFFIITALFSLAMLPGPKPIAQKKGTVKFTFVNKVKDQRITLNDSTYTNPFKETYTISKLKYYIGHAALQRAGTQAAEKNTYHLIDESKLESQSFSFDVPAGAYAGISFQLGVDSIYNVSGAQTGALDPLNDMFWTWNSGYVMFKLEGNAPASTMINNKIEYHVGGYAGANKAMRYVMLGFPKEQMIVKPGMINEVIITADIDKLWNAAHDIRIADDAAIMTPGPLSKRIADNYALLFNITDINHNSRGGR